MIMSALNESLKKNNSSKEINATPKRRGRKRKSEVAIKDVKTTTDINEASAPVDTVSRRGRRHRRVNYYELANPENLEDLPVENEYFPTENDETKNRKRKKITEDDYSAEVIRGTSLENDKEVTQTHEEDDDATHVEINQNQEEINQNQEEISLNGTKDDSHDKDKEISLQEDSIDLEATTSTPKMKDKRYNYTGETVKMMNTLFNLFASKDEGKKVENGKDNITNGSSENGVVVNSTPNKRPYRKQKKGVKDEEMDDGFGNVICAVCNTTLDKVMWNHHKQRYHNNLAWRVGDPPLDLSDQSFVMHTLNMLYKKKKPLYCDKCGEVKKSVVGFLSHQSTCKKSEEQLESIKISCELCGKKMLPVSLTTHMKFCHQNPKAKEEIVEKPVSDNNKTSATPSKRSAAKKALKIIENVTKNDFNEDKYFTSNLNFDAQDFAQILIQKELSEKQFIDCKFGCGSQLKDLEEIFAHFDNCDEKPNEGYACKECLLVSTKLEEIIYHIEVAHDVNVEVDDAIDEKITTKMPAFLNWSVKKMEKVLFPGAFQWTLKFQEDNYSDLLFDNLINQLDWPLLPPNMAAKYLPNMNESCDVARIFITSFINPLDENYDFEKYKLFESQLHEDNKITLFCGGPISSLSWLPIPHFRENDNQILAVSILNSPDEKYETSDNYQVASAIQFWNFGPLKNKEFSMRIPKLIFNLAHDHGPVWHMEWCPSGCYNYEFNRLGLLAVTGSDSVVYIYSISFFKEEKGLYYKPKPVIKLLLQRPNSPLLGGLKYCPTKISWTKASGHNYIAVGYTNGFIGLFNLKTNSVISKFKDSEGIVCILPYKSFQGHSHSISALALYHLNGGSRWLMSGSIDRAVNLWDLNNCSYPMNTIKKNMITDGFWFTNWLCYVTACDEGSTSTYVTTMLKQTRDYLCDPNVTLTCSPSTISSISGSDWLNGMLHANMVGEIVGMFPHQILQIPEHHKIFKKKRMLFGYTYLIEKNKTPEQRVADDKFRKKILQNLLTKKLSAGIKLSKIKADFDQNCVNNEPVIYHKAEEKYGLLFCDNRMESFSDYPDSTANQLSAFSKSYGITQPNQYPMTAINKIVFNPNRQASLYYATGYQAGFVRISWMAFLKGDQQVQ